MSKEFEIKIDDIELRKIELRLGSLAKKAPLLISRSLNRAATSANATIIKGLTTKYNLKAKDIRGLKDESGKVQGKKYYISKATSSSLSTLIIYRDVHLGLHHFPHKPESPGPGRQQKVCVAVERSGLKPLGNTAFLVDRKKLKYAPDDLKAGEKYLIMERASQVKDPSKVTMKSMYAPAIPQMVKDAGIRQAADRKAVETYYKNLDHEIIHAQEVAK